MRKNKKTFVIGWALLLSISVFWISGFSKGDDQDEYYHLKNSWVHMQRVYEQLNLHYVEEINPYPLVKAGIDGMLDELDPYTVFIDEDGERRFRIITTGKYGGLGIEIGLRRDNITVISPMEDSPAQRAGIKAGDIIDKVDDKLVSDFSIREVSKLLRGKIGTVVKLELIRPGFEEPIELVLKREEIILKDVGYTGYLDPGIGYIRLKGFTEKASSEVRKAILNLKNQGTLDALILDLRGNPGGLLESAVEIVNLFVDKSELVVFTKGYNEQEIKFYTERNPVLPDLPLAVLVDEGSASASEIVAGALQDLDRAIIVGEETFGKGLVQKIYTVDKNSDARIKITTAKYYIPSGRCIQKKDYLTTNKVINGHKTELVIEDDVKYFTRNHREVYDQGGIYPDVSVEGDSIGYITVELIRQNMFFDFAVKFHLDNPDGKDHLGNTDHLFSEFETFLEDRDFDYDIEGSRELAKLESITQNKSYKSEISTMISKIRETLEIEKENEFSENRRSIERYIHLELVEKYLNKSAKDSIALNNDQQVQEALRIVQNHREYKTILAVKN